jgi:outer membrane protein, protease secretion system
VKIKEIQQGVISSLFALSLMQIGDVHALGLIEAFQSALTNDTIFRAALYDNQAGQQYRKIGRANLLPNVSASYSFNKIRSDISTTNNGQPVDINRNFDSKNAVIQIRQPLINMDSWARYKLGNLQSDLSDVELEINKQLLIQRFFGAFSDANYAQDLLNLAIAERDAYLNQEKANQFIFDSGEGTKTELIESRAKLSFSEAQVIESKNNMIDTHNAFKNIVGTNFDRLNALTAEFKPIELEPFDFESLQQIALEKNPELLAKKSAVQIAEQEVKKSFAGHMPQLDAVASISQNSSETVVTFNQDINNKSIGLQLNIPIYAGGSVNAITIQNEAKLEKAKADFDTKTKETLAELRTQYNNLQAGTLKINALLQSVESAELLIQATEKSILAGIRTNQDLLNARKQLFETKRDLSLAKYQYLMAFINLKKAAGILSDLDIEKLATYFPN